MDVRNEFLASIYAQVQAHPQRVCWRATQGDALTYQELWDSSDELACSLHELIPSHAPLLVYGHKSPSMVLCFLACLKSGHAYVPCDTHVPPQRVSAILSQLPHAPVLAVEDMPNLGEKDPLPEIISASHIDTCRSRAADGQVRRPQSSWSVAGSQTQYIIFTSGSTGTPKGVEITADDVAHFMPWDQSLFADAQSPAVFLNQALLSFDLSVTELVAGLTTGSTVVALTSEVLEDPRVLYDEMAYSGATCWVSTPTFASACLADPSFSHELMPRLSHFFFCGEPLRPDVVRNLHERFPEVAIINAYGPTESTVAVSAVRVETMGDVQVLPVGHARPGTTFVIIDPETGSELPHSTSGEVLICGDTVAKGYLGKPEQTAAVFGERDVAGHTIATYRSGDLGMLDEDGMLWVSGRRDDQVKIHGFRIELGEIEATLQAEPDIKLVSVIVRTRHGIADRLEAHVELVGERPADAYAWGKALRTRLAQRLPTYMVPRKIVVEDALPTTPNGKVDRKALKNMVGEA